MLKILITGGDGMLAHDFKAIYSEKFEIFSYDKKSLNICDFNTVERIIGNIQPDIVLNLAAYTAVDDAEDIGATINYEVNTLGVYHLAKVSKKYAIDFMTTSTDYVFHGDQQNGYSENDIPHPINAYGMAKYIGEKLALSENENTIIIRTSWLYGGGREYKNFVNTMLQLGEKGNPLRVVADQFGSPTNCTDLSKAIVTIMEKKEQYRGNIFHLSNKTPENGISWHDFAQEIFKLTHMDTALIACTTLDFPTRAKRPAYSKLINNSDIQLPNWKDTLQEYINSIKI